MPDRVDLLIRNGRLVIPRYGMVKGNVAVTGGRISALTDSEPPSKTTIDARDRYVIPGVMDPHTHFYPLADRLRSESGSALLGGVTTVGCFMGDPGSYREALPKWKQAVEENSSIDVLFHPVIGNEVQQAEIPYLTREAGVRSIKLYLAGVPGKVVPISDDFLLETMKLVVSLGAGTVVCVHAENQNLIDGATRRVQADVADGSRATLADLSACHPNVGEEEAAFRASCFARRTGIQLYLVHIGTKEAIGTLGDLRKLGYRTLVETTSPYLSVNCDSGLGPAGKMLPPFREQASVDALWEGVRSGVVDTIGTDNVPKTLEAKMVEKGMWDAGAGAAALATHLPVLLHEGVHKRGIDLLQLIEKITFNPARIFGLHSKGTLLPGSDADLAVVDLNLEKVVESDKLASVGDFSFYEGMKLKGWPVYTVKGGQVVVEEGKLAGKTAGAYLNTGATA